AACSADDSGPEDLGLHVWPGTHAMSHLILDLEKKGSLIGRSVLDVGCGTGFIGILARLAGCGDLVLADCEEKVLATARLNVKANGFEAGSGVKVKALSWGLGAVDETEGATFDVVLLCEVLYVAQPRCVPWTLDSDDVSALAALTKAKLSPGGEAWVTYGNREEGGMEMFRDAAVVAGLTFEEVALKAVVPAEDLARKSANALRRVKVFHLTHAK
ncbi:unnamed protein product, partial [Polarella glacialis]